MIRLVRQSSDTPNITNKDDVRMVRYAYGGYDGAVKNYGQSLEYTVDATNGIFKIGSGRFVMQGWEIDLDEQGWSFSFKGVTGIRYYNVYLELNLSTETATIQAVYGSSIYPSTQAGDDLTSVSLGTARFVLYRLIVSNGSVTQVVKGFNTIKYTSDLIKDLEEGYSNADTLVHNRVTTLKNDVEDALEMRAVLSGPVLTGSESGDINFTVGTLLIVYVPPTYLQGAFATGSKLVSPSTIQKSDGSTEKVGLYLNQSTAEIMTYKTYSYSYIHHLPGTWFSCGRINTQDGAGWYLMQRIA